MLSRQAAAGILDAVESFVKGAQLHWSKVHVPLAVVDLFEADVFAREDVAHIDPSFLPADAAERAGGKRDAIVGAEDLGQAVLLKQPREDRTALSISGAGEAATGEQVATETILHGERVTIAAIAAFELALVVGRPDHMGGAWA